MDWERLEAKAKTAKMRAENVYRTEIVPNTGGLTRQQLDANAEAAYNMLRTASNLLHSGGSPFFTAQQVYVISHASFNAVKVGVGSSGRITAHVNRGWVLEHVTSATLVAREIEQTVLRRVRSAGVAQGVTSEEMIQGGSTETMDGSQISAAEVWAMVQEEHHRFATLLVESLGGGEEAPEIISSLDDTLELPGVGRKLPELLDRAAAGMSTVLTREGNPIAAIVSMEDYRALQAAADEFLAREAVEHQGDKTTKMVDILASLMEGRGV
ncbi:type II toxin-antitoxin system Phd/YefM family antitoxin [Streptomyces sp. NPDC006487]|uniref:type II toxin-antitoxin system Phd/YefM family antitoxin n=1 Tax=Streptomyces sp. NPDC006487 TaxID=3364748 RepID=UPI0036B4B173